MRLDLFALFFFLTSSLLSFAQNEGAIPIGLYSNLVLGNTSSTDDVTYLDCDNAESTTATALNMEIFAANQSTFSIKLRANNWLQSFTWAKSFWFMDKYCFNTNVFLEGSYGPWEGNFVRTEVINYTDVTDNVPFKIGVIVHDDQLFSDDYYFSNWIEFTKVPELPVGFVTNTAELLSGNQVQFTIVYDQTTAIQTDALNYSEPVYSIEVQDESNVVTEYPLPEDNVLLFSNGNYRWRTTFTQTQTGGDDYVGYSEWQSLVVTTISGVVDINNEAFNVYPNPSSGNFNVRLPVGKFNINVSDMTGRTIQKHTNQSGLISFSLSNGMYIITVHNNSFSSTKQVIIE